MQSLRRCVQNLVPLAAVARQQPLNSVLANGALSSLGLFHSSPVSRYQTKPRNFVRYNNKIYPVQGPNEERRLAYVCHKKENIKYSYKKMWYIACLIRGMSVDEALKQLSFLLKKGAIAVKETILEAQKLAVEKHNVEFKSNLWVAESFCSKGVVIKGVRRHARARFGEIRYGYVHYFVRLEEGPPPEHYYLPIPKDKDDLLDDWKRKMRTRKIYNSL